MLLVRLETQLTRNRLMYRQALYLVFLLRPRAGLLKRLHHLRRVRPFCRRVLRELLLLQVHRHLPACRPRHRQRSPLHHRHRLANHRVGGLHLALVG